VAFGFSFIPLGKSSQLLLWIGMAFSTMALSVLFFGSKAERKKQLI
jgi:hypothetical protein